jgi:hypothetical protein
MTAHAAQPLSLLPRVSELHVEKFERWTAVVSRSDSSQKSMTDEPAPGGRFSFADLHR